MIEHRKTGYVAKERDADDLAKGINWVLEPHSARHSGRTLSTRSSTATRSVPWPCSISTYTPMPWHKEDIIFNSPPSSSNQ